MQGWTRPSFKASSTKHFLLRSGKSLACQTAFALACSGYKINPELINEMAELTGRNFGLLIAYLIPGFVVLLGISHLSPTLQTWLSAATNAEDLPTIGGFLYVTLASVGLGMTVSAVRWFLIDRINEWTGLKRPRWDDSRLQVNLEAFDLIVEHHYRYYQFYANNVVALLTVYGAHRYGKGFPPVVGWPEIGLVGLLVVFWAMSRDTVRKYYNRASALLNYQEPKMGNGSHPKTETTSKPGSSEQSKPADQHAADGKKASKALPGDD